MTHGEKIDKVLIEFPEQLRPQLKKLAGTIIDIAIFELTKSEYPQYFNTFAEVEKLNEEIKCPHKNKRYSIMDRKTTCLDCDAKKNDFGGKWRLKTDA